MKRIIMRQIREVFRLKFESKLSNAKIAASVGIGETTIEQYVTRARVNKLSWPLPQDMSDQQLEQLLYPIKESEQAHLDLGLYSLRVKKKGVILA